jgi:sugar lactone lactonase YvrE
MLTAGGGFIRQIGADGLVRTLVADQNMASHVRLVADRQGDIFYSVTLGIRKRTSAGSIVAVAGAGPSLPQEGAAAANTWVQVQGMAVDPADNLVFSESQSLSVWRIDGGGVLRRLAGTGSSGTAGEGGPAASAQLEFPNDLAFDANGALYIRDQDRILKIGADGNLVRLDSIAVPGHGGILTVDSAGRVFVTGSGGFQIFRLETSGSFASFAGTGDDAFSNGCGSAASPSVGDAKTGMFGPVTGMAVDPAGNLLVVDQSRFLLRQVTPGGQVRTIAGAPPSLSGDGGPASEATLYAPQGIAFDGSGNMYIADTGNHRVRKVTADGTIRSIAGQHGPTGDMNYGCSGAGPDALRLPQAVAVAPGGDLFIADTGNNRVMKLAPDGTLTRFAGTGTAGFALSPIGTPADSVPLNQPRAVGVDRKGNIWIGDNATRTLKVASDGTIVNVLPRLRTRSFSTDAQGKLYLTSAWVVYEVMDDDQLVPVAGTIRDSQIPPSGTPPVNEMDTILDIGAGSGLTRDGQGTLYNIGQRSIDLISTGCHTEPLPSTPDLLLPNLRLAHVAEGPAGDVYAADAGSNVIWRLPHLATQPDDLPSPQLAAGSPVQNAASMLAASQDYIVPTGGFSSATIRDLVNPPIARGKSCASADSASGRPRRRWRPMTATGGCPCRWRAFRP